MATESLIVELDARTAKLDAKLNSTNDKLDKLTKSAENSDSGLKKMGSGAKIAGTAILQTAAAAVALAGAVSAIVLSSAKSRRELELLAKQAKTSTSDFQALSFATNTYGITGEQIADISKDIADKIGEFSAAGTGAFQDYADVMKLTKDQARETAQEFEGLSSQEILGTMVSRMEDASVSGDKMTFVLESLGNDASRLLPLFIGNSKQLLELKKRFDDVNKSLQLTGTQAEALRDVSNTFTLLSSSAGNAATAISSTLSHVLDDFFNDIIAVVPDATQTIIDFVNSFLDAENITSIAGVNKEILKVNESIAKTSETMINQVPRMRAGSEAQLAGDQLRLEKLQAQLLLLTEQEKKLEDVNRLSGGKIGTGTPDPLPSGGGLGTGDEVQAIADRFKRKETLLAENLTAELKLVGDNEELKANLAQEFIGKLKKINKGADEELKSQTQTKDQAEIESLVKKQERLQEFLNNKLISEQQYQEKLRELIGEYSPETLNPSILEDQNQNELDLLNEKLSNQLISYEDYFSKLKGLQDKDEKDKENSDKNSLKSEERIEGLKRSFTERTAQTLLSSAATTQQKLFSIVKDAAAGQIEAYGLTAGAKALAELGPIAGPPVAASYIGWSQVAAGIVRALPLGGGGGGTAPGNGSTQTQQTQPQPQQENFTPETSSLDFNNGTQGGNTNINLTVPDGDEIGMALANWILKAQKEGRV